MTEQNGKVTNVLDNDEKVRKNIEEHFVGILNKLVTPNQQSQLSQNIETKEEMKNNAENAVEAKKEIKEKKLTSRPRPIPQVVLEEAKKHGGHAVFLEDAKGNRVYVIRVGKEPRAKTISIMTEKKGQEVSAPLLAKDSMVKKFVNQVRKEVSNKNSDISNAIDAISAKNIKETTKSVSLDKSEKVDLKLNMNDAYLKIESRSDINNLKLNLKPTVTLVPHIKKNGKPSKRNFDIQLRDADGKIFTVTEKMANKVFKRDLDNGEKDTYLWATYIEACKKGKVTPEFLEEKFFKGQVNLGDGKTPEANKETTKSRIPEIPLEEVTMADTGGKGAYDGMALGAGGMPINNEVNISTAKTLDLDSAKYQLQDGDKIIEAIKMAQAEQERDAINKAFAKSLENAEMKTYSVNEGVNDPFKKAKVEETTINVQQTESFELPKDEKIDGLDFEVMQKEAQKQTRTTTPEGITYSFDGDKLVVNGTALSRDVEHLMPGYEKEQSSKQVYGFEAKVAINHAYKDDKGNYHCGGSVGTNYNAVKMQEREILNGIVTRNAVYSDLKRESAKRDLSEPEKKFMKTHEDMLQQRGLIRCDDGVLEYKGCPKDQYDQASHACAQKLNLEILRGEKKSRTTTINTGTANVAQMQMSKDGNIM